MKPAPRTRRSPPAAAALRPSGGTRPSGPPTGQFTTSDLSSPGVRFREPAIWVPLRAETWPPRECAPTDGRLGQLGLGGVRALQERQPMPGRHRSHSGVFKRQALAEHHAGKTLHTLSSRRDLSWNPIRIRDGKAETGALDENAAAASLSAHEARIAAVETW